MSSFHLLLEDEAIQTLPPNRKKHNKKHQSTKILSEKVIKENEFSKIHLHEVWVVILSFFDTKTQYKTFIFVDKLVCGILYSIPILKSHLQKTFSGIISGEEEQDHLPLLNHGTKTLQKKIETIFSINDPLNIFGFRSLSPNENTSISESDNISLTFHNLYISLLNRRLNITNRNIKLREFLGLGNCLDCPACYNRKNNNQIHCEHFRIVVKHDPSSNYILNIECKSCLLHQNVQLATSLSKIKQFC